MRHLRISLFVIRVALWPLGASAEETLLLCGFEDENSLRAWEYRSGIPRLVTEGVTQGTHALEITFDPRGEYHPAYLTWRKVYRNWSAFDALSLDIFNADSNPVPAYVLIADQAWADKNRSYWNRHNAERVFPLGRTRWLVPVRGLYRGEAGSRNNDIKTDIDPANIVRLDFGFGRKGAKGRIIIDNLCLIKSERPAGVWAFDFGPPSQALMPGWSAVSHATRYNPTQGYGWGPVGGTPWNGAARDTTFGPAALRDFCEAGGYCFRIDLPPARYRFVIFYENSGYWGGEQARHRTRRILANNREVWNERRPDGEAHALYRFEDIDPGADIWTTYMAAELAKPAIFEVESQTGSVVLRFEADKVWGSKIAAIIAYDSNSPHAMAWAEEQLAKIESEFRTLAVCLDPPASPVSIPNAWQGRDLICWPAKIEESIVPASLPPADLPSPDELYVERAAARGEYEPFCVALRALRDLGTCRILLEPFDGPGGRLEAQIGIVFFKPERGFGQIAYSIRPDTVRPGNVLELKKDVTREVIVTVWVPRNAGVGEYQSRLRFADASGRELAEVGLKLIVSSVVLSRETDFLMGFFGILPPELLPSERREVALEETLVLLRNHGMNAVCGGPRWQLKGWQDDKPVIDFSAMDRFVALLKKHGFTGPINAYGGSQFEGLHSRYTAGEAAEQVCRQSGLDYEEALRRCWETVSSHAQEAGWPLLYYCLCDETRVRETAEQELAFMRMMGKISAAFPRTVRTSGAYGVTFRTRPTDPNDLLYWHQRFFETLDVSNLNAHDATVMEEARKLGKEIHIYNQGRTRYSFGLYQWSEYRKGIRARWQWHLNVLHGYQFFDLDGREPDTAMICYGRKAIYPTIHFERIREGAEDFYLYETLAEELELQRRIHDNTPSTAPVEALLTRLANIVELNQRNQPPGFDADALKYEVLKTVERLKAQ